MAAAPAGPCRGLSIFVICKVTVKQPVTSIKLNKTSATLDKGKSLTLKATVLPGNANNKSVTWNSSNEKVATVSSKGVIKTVENGKAVIVAKAKDGSGKKASCKKTVSTSSTPSKPNLPENNETIITTPEQLFGVEPRSEADCEYPLDRNKK